MIENYLLEELVTFQRMGTLKKTAAHLAVTQPTVTRGMQKLEDGLGVKLFDRHPNRLELTAAGELAAKEAAAVLRRQELMVNRVQNFVAQNQALTIGAVVPGPLIILKRLAGAPLFNHQVDERLVEPERVPEELTDDRLGMVFTTTDLTGPDLISQPLGGSISLSTWTASCPRLTKRRSVLRTWRDCPLSSLMTSGRGRT